MKIYNRGGKAYVRLGGRRLSLNVPFTDKPGAQQALALLLTSPAPAKPVPAGPTLAAVCEDAQRLYYRGDKGKNQQVDAKIEELLVFFGRNLSIAEVKPKRIEEWKAHLADRKNTGKTINRKLAVLSKVLHLAVEWGYLTDVPKIRREKEAKGRIRWLSDAEEQAALRYWRGSQMADALMVLLDTGVRPSELRRIDRKQDVDGMMLRVWKQKGDVPRSIPLSVRAKAALSRQGVDNFAWLTEDKLVHEWNAMKAALGIKDKLFVSYATRHTFAVRMLEEGVDVYTLKELMGHSKLETTMIYAHVTKKLKVAAIRKLEARGTVPMGGSAKPIGVPVGSAKALTDKVSDLTSNRSPAINSPSLYRLSYQGIFNHISHLTAPQTSYGGASMHAVTTAVPTEEEKTGDCPPLQINPKPSSSADA